MQVQNEQLHENKETLTFALLNLSNLIVVLQFTIFNLPAENLTCVELASLHCSPSHVDSLPLGDNSHVLFGSDLYQNLYQKHVQHRTSVNG